MQLINGDSSMTIVQIFQIIGVFVAVIMSFLAFFRNSAKDQQKARDEQNIALSLITREQNIIQKDMAEKLSAHMLDDMKDISHLQESFKNLNENQMKTEKSLNEKIDKILIKALEK
jgi:ribosomal protein L16 Arg81 hydroxylase